MKLSFKRIFWLSLLVVIVVFFIAAFITLNRSTKGLTQAEKNQDLSKILGRPVVLKGKTIPVGDIAYKGKYYSFSYPEAAVKYKPGVQSGSGLENFEFDMSSPRIYVVTEVIAASADQKVLDDNSGVRMREVQNTLYHQSTITADGQTGLGFEKNDSDGVEKSGFFLVNGKYYSFSLVGNDKASIDSLFVKLIASLKFL